MLKATLIAYPNGKAGFVSAGFIEAAPGSVWAWASRVVAAKYECSEDEVRCDDEDRITVRGTPVATLETGSYETTAQIAASR